MTVVKRAFIAIDLPRAVAQELGELIGELKKRIGGFRWVNTGGMHLTLKFIGEVEPEKFDEIAALVAGGFGGGDELSPGGSIGLRAEGVGVFPSRERARVIWAGVGGELTKLSRLALGVEAALERVGVPRERRLFEPHLTLGRLSQPGRGRDVPRMLSEFKEFRGGPWEARSLVLYESELLSGGAKHAPRAEWQFDRA